MQYEFILEDKLAQPTICIRTRTPVGNLPHILGNAFESLINYLAETDTIPTYAPYVGYFNMDMQDLDIEIGYPVAQPLAGKMSLSPVKSLLVNRFPVFTLGHTTKSNPPMRPL